MTDITIDAKGIGIIHITDDGISVSDAPTEDGCNECGDAIERREEDGTPWCHPCYHARGGEDLDLISPYDDEDTIALRHAINEVPAMEPDAFLEMAYEDRFTSDLD